MIDLPKTTEFNRRIPKQKFYENLNISPKIKQIFTEQIRTVYWRNKISPETINIPEGNTVNELEIIEIRLNQQSFDEEIFRLIDKSIPHYILFLLEYEGKQQAWIGYKELSVNNKKAKIIRYYNTEWLENELLSLTIEGLNLDDVYENYVRQIAGDKLTADTDGESLKESIKKDEQRRALQKQINALKAKMHKEKQLKRQMEINHEIKKLKKELKSL